MAADKMKEILKHFPDLEEGWKEMEEKLKAEPAEREMLSLKYRQMVEREKLTENLPEPEFTKAKRAEPAGKDMDLGCGVIWKDVEPASEDLEKAACNYGDELDNVLIVGIDDDNTVGEYATQAFKAGAHWQKQQMMKQAISSQCFGRNLQGEALFSFPIKSDKYLVGSEVKMIIIKED